MLDKFFSSCVWIAPGLFSSTEAVQKKIPAELYTWLKKTRVDDTTLSFYPSILNRFGYKEYDVDWASLRAAFDGFSNDEHYLCADPIHLGVDAVHVYSLGSAYLDLTLDEAKAYINYLNRYLTSVSLSVGVDPYRWYLCTPLKCDVDVCAPDQIFSSTLMNRLPKGHDRLKVLSWFNDIQMLLHECDLNRERQKKGRATIDALWLWGSGAKIKMSMHAPFDCVISNHPLVLGLAKLNNIFHIHFPSHDQWIDILKAHRAVLVVDDRYQFVDATEKPHQYFPMSCLPYLDELHVEANKIYVRKNFWKLCYNFTLR